MKKIRIGEIYKHTNKITGDAYVGKTIAGRQVRWAAHVLAAALGSQTHFARAIRMYGPESFRHRTLKRVTEPVLNVAEIHFIARHDTFKHGYNMTRGGEGNSGDPLIGRKISRGLRKLFREHPELIAAMSRRALTFYATPEGGRCAEQIAKTLTGHKHGKRARRNMIAGLVRRYEDEAAHLQTSKAGKRYSRTAVGKAEFKTRGEKIHQTYEKNRVKYGGKGHSPETRQLLSDLAKAQWAAKRDVMMEALSNCDRTVSLKTRRQISKTLKKTYAEHPELMVEHVKKMTGRKASDETRALQSAGISAAWEAKPDAEKAKISRKRSRSLVKHFDKIGRKPAHVYKQSLEVRANKSAGARKRRANESAEDRAIVAAKISATRRASALKKAA